MDVKQIYEFLNGAREEVFGAQDTQIEDLSGIVQLGTTIENAVAYEKFANALVNRIGRTIFVARKYDGGAPSVYRDEWEFGSIKQKIQAELPQATENETWELQDGQSYDENIFYGSKVSVKFYNGKVAYEIPLSVTNEQLKQSFLSLESMNSFLSMLYNNVQNALTIYMDLLISRTINNFIGETIFDEYGSSALNSKSTVKAINLLYEYNQKHQSATLTASNCLESPEFLRWATYRMKRYVARFRKATKLYNIDKKVRFTPTNLLHFVVLADFASLQETYLQSTTYHDEMVKLPYYEEVACWQSMGDDDSMEESSKIHVNTASGHEIECSGVLAVMFDHDALGVTNYNRRVTSHYNAKAEFTNQWHKSDGEYFNDTSENFVVFFIA